MNVNELREKYRALLSENSALREENEILKARLGMSPSRPNPHRDSENHLPWAREATDLPEKEPQMGVPSQLDPAEKIRLFMSLFKGREDVYAKRWQNREGRAGYAPVCRNEWRAGLCRKPTVKCVDCPLDEKVIEAHLRGSVVAGLYPLRRDDPIALERSRSGNGSHAWFFFVEPLPAVLARKFGSVLLTCAMSRRHERTFKSYDRFFPNQDTLPKGGFGNLIALPLQKTARDQGNSVFVDETSVPMKTSGASWPAPDDCPKRRSRN